MGGSWMGYLGWALAGALAVIVAILVMMRTSANVRGNISAPVGSASRTWAINRAFQDYWPDASHRMRAWVAGLTDPQYADVFTWLVTTINGADRDGVDARPAMLAHFRSIDVIDEDDFPGLSRASLDDFRRLAVVMQAA